MLWFQALKPADVFLRSHHVKGDDLQKDLQQEDVREHPLVNLGIVRVWGIVRPQEYG